MAVNDLITVGATPLVVQAYWAAGGSDWFGDAQRAQALVDGWKRACDTCGVAWGGGETPALAGIVESGPHRPRGVVHRPRQPEGAAVGRRQAGPRRRDRAAGLQRHPRQRPEPGAQAGRAPAAGLPHAGGARASATARRCSRRPRCIRRSPRRCGPAGIAPHYCANITGHGWRKLLRHPGRFTYRIAQRAAGAAGADASSSSTRSRTTARPTARSTWAPASRCSSRPSDAQRTVDDRAGARRRRAAWPAASRPGAKQLADRAAGHPLQRRRPAAALSDGSRPKRSRPGRLQSAATGLLAWKRGQPGQVGNEAALTVATSAEGKARHLHSSPACRGRRPIGHPRSARSAPSAPRTRSEFPGRRLQRRVSLAAAQRGLRR